MYPSNELPLLMQCIWCDQILPADVIAGTEVCDCEPDNGLQDWQPYIWRRQGQTVPLSLDTVIECIHCGNRRTLGQQVTGRTPCDHVTVGFGVCGSNTWLVSHKWWRTERTLSCWELAKKWGLQWEWLTWYRRGRKSEGYSPDEAAYAAAIDWDLF